MKHTKMTGICHQGVTLGWGQAKLNEKSSAKIKGNTRDEMTPGGQFLNALGSVACGIVSGSLDEIQGSNSMLAGNSPAVHGKWGVLI